MNSTTREEKHTKAHKNWVASIEERNLYLIQYSEGELAVNKMDGIVDVTNDTTMFDGTVVLNSAVNVDWTCCLKHSNDSKKIRTPVSLHNASVYGLDQCVCVHCKKPHVSAQLIDEISAQKKHLTPHNTKICV